MLDDKFCFRFFPIETEHVNKIITILLDNAHACSNIVFGTKEAFKKTLERYMATPCTYGKRVTGDAPEQRRKLLENLATVMKALGSTAKPIWTEDPGHPLSESERMRILHFAMRRKFADSMGSFSKEFLSSPESDRGFMTSYLLLGGSAYMLFEDLEQSELMLTLRIKTDVWSKGLSQPIRGQAREWVKEAYIEGCLPRRMFLYLKHVRCMVLWQDQDGRLMKDIKDPDAKIEGPEDVIAEAAHKLMTPKGLNALVYRTHVKDIDKAKVPNFDPWAKVPRSMAGALHLAYLRRFMLDPPGKLKECGIHEVERLALSQEKLLLEQGLHGMREFNYYAFFDDDEKVEILTRVMARPLFQGALKDKMKASLLGKFEKVLFEVAYPTPPIKVTF
ncbi:hypothetical protein F4819DRAFT_507580 [Hypoxylon fuscum]|nr:hypothetical protein F4819DRAFT_507580 [Hypoxylon fuscum]